MAIEFHCEHCGKLVRAAAEHAGKRGKCPGCHQSVYIPTPDDQIEILDVAPVDQDDEQRKKELLDETRDLTHSIMHDRESPPESAADTRPGPASLGDARLAKAAMESQVIQYARSMAAGNLAEAEKLAEEIRRDMTIAEEVMQQLTVDEIPPEDLADIPRPVLVAFFKQLRDAK